MYRAIILKLRDLVKIDSDLFRLLACYKYVLSSEITAYTHLWEVVIFPAVFLLSLEDILHMVLYQ